jgi:serine O-acetyltransferase
MHKLENKTGFSFENNCSIGDGFIIGHWGKIVVNGKVKFGNQFFVTHGVTIGRDIRGKRKGVPTFGDRVCVRTNSTIVGNIHIGNDVLIAPNTFVNFDVPDHSVVVGNPARIHHRDNATEGHIPCV